MTQLNSPTPQNNSRAAVEAGAVGAGGGAGLVALLNSLFPDGSSLAYLIPTMSLGISAIWLGLSTHVPPWLQTMIENYRDDKNRQLMKAISQAIKRHQKELRDKDIPEAEKARIRDEIAELRRRRRSLYAMKVNVLASELVEDSETKR